MMTPQSTIDTIIRAKKRELLKEHRNLIERYFIIKKDIKVSTIKRLLAYYDTKINTNNIEHHYPKPIQLFLTELLS